MEKRHQVFVSSTFIDLENERKVIQRALLQMDCIPAGMEFFPASNRNHWKLITKEIDRSDFYIVISAGRYGSIYEREGISHTEKEFIYAKNKKKPILGFLRKSINDLPENKKDSYCDGSGIDREKQCKLEIFRRSICSDDTQCNFWENSADLYSSVLASISMAQRENSESPGTGWFRFNDKSGVASMSYGENIDPALAEYFRNSKETKIIFTTGRTTIESYGSDIIRGINNGCRVRILTSRKGSDYINDMHKIQRENKCGVLGTHDLNGELEHLFEFFNNNTLDVSKSSVEIRDFKTYFRANMFIFDNRICYYTPTLPQNGSHSGICFKLTIGEILRSCVTHFDSVWDACKK